MIDGGQLCFPPFYTLDQEHGAVGCFSFCQGSFSLFLSFSFRKSTSTKCDPARPTRSVFLPPALYLHVKCVCIPLTSLFPPVSEPPLSAVADTHE